MSKNYELSDEQLDQVAGGIIGRDIDGDGIPDTDCLDPDGDGIPGISKKFPIVIRL